MQVRVRVPPRALLEKDIQRVLFFLLNSLKSNAEVAQVVDQTLPRLGSRVRIASSARRKKANP